MKMKKRKLIIHGHWLIQLTLLLIINLQLVAQNDTRVITGTVTDFEGNPLPGATVSVKGTTLGAVTNLDGEYSIRASDEDILRFSFVGYISEEVPVGDNTVVDVSISEDITQLDQVVVVGYGTQKKSDVTGSIVSVSQEDLAKMPVTSVSEALQGKASGVFISRSSGSPSSGAEVNIRGVGSINGMSPLWVVDGIKNAPVPEVDNIASIEILKDASSAAIYGKDAAGGVIIVTTKSGSNRDSRISFHSYFSIDQSMPFPELLTADEFADRKIEALYRSGFDSTTVQDGYAYYFQDFGEGTNWADEMFRTGFQQNYNLAASGGNERASYFISGNYKTQTGTIIETEYSSYSFNVNSDFKINDFIKVGESIRFSRSENSPLINATRNIYTSIFRGLATIPVYDETNIRGGGYGYLPDSVQTASWQGANPVAMANLLQRREYNNRLFANFFADINIFKGLVWKTNVSGKINGDVDKEWEYPFYNSQTNLQPYNTLYWRSGNSYSYLMNSLLTYNNTFGDHGISLLAGWEASKGWGLNITTQSREIPSFSSPNTGLGNPEFISGGMGLSQGGDYAYFGRLNYDYKSKYLLTSNIRIDASNNFGPENFIGVFPSFSFGWKLSEEQFMESLAVVDLLKLRIGYGVNGKDNIGSYRFTTNYNGSSYQDFGGTLYGGFSRSGFANAGIHWEEVKMLNYGLDFGLYRNRLQGSLEYYDKKTQEMLINIPLSNVTGFSSAPSNLGEVSNKGVELNIEWKESIGRFFYSFGGNIAYNKNELVYLGSDVGASDFLSAGPSANFGHLDMSGSTEGEPIAFFYGFITDEFISSQEQLNALNENSPTGVYQNINTAPGDLLYKDIGSFDENNNIIPVPDGLINDADKTILGKPWPDFVYGFSGKFDYRGFDFAMYWQGIAGIEVYNLNKMFTDQFFSDFNSSERLKDAWSLSNTNGEVPRLTVNDPNQNFQTPSSYFVENGAYLRLKNIQIGYTLPNALTNRIKVSNLRFYVSGINLLTFTPYSGIDPEFNSSGGGNLSERVDNSRIYPQYKSYVFGVKFDF